MSSRPRASTNAWESLDPSVAPVYAERPPLFIYDPHQTGLGAGLVHGWTTPRTTPSYRKVMNARSIGQRLIVSRGGEVVIDAMLASDQECVAQLATFANRSTSLFHEDTDVMATDQGYVSDRLDRPDVRIEEPVLSLLSVEPSNYGSWLFRVLPKLLFLEQLDDPSVKVACWCPARWQKDLLAFFGIGEDRIININLAACYEFRELYVPVVLNPFAYMSEDTLSFFRRTLAARGIEAKRKKLIYISRQTRAAAAGYANVRHFVDEPALIERLKATGFEITEPENLSIEQQVSLFASAAMVVGASGAGMFNTAFSAPGTGLVDIEAFPDWLYAHCNYFSSCGHSYGVAFGMADPLDPSETHKRWSITVPGLMERIGQLRDLLGS